MHNLPNQMKQARLHEFVEELVMPDPFAVANDPGQNEIHVPESFKTALENLEYIKSEENYGIKKWPVFWIKVEREPTPEIEKLAPEGGDWKFWYPRENDWASIEIVCSDNSWSIYVENELWGHRLSFDEEFGFLKGFQHIEEDPEQSSRVSSYLDWLGSELQKRIDSVVSDADAYNESVEEDLNHRERYGVIKRKDFFSILKEDKCLPRDMLTDEEIKKFVEIAPSLNESEAIPVLTAKGYLSIVGLCYSAAELSDGRPPEELYDSLADSRHGGLRDLDPVSSKELWSWLKDVKYSGCHPFEIVRGGTLESAIHLYPMIDPESKGIKLILTGKSELRSALTVKMALRLHESGIPFSLGDADLLSLMVQGEDYIGLRPACRPYEGPDSILKNSDFQISTEWSSAEVDEHPELVEAVEWFPVERLESA